MNAMSMSAVSDISPVMSRSEEFEFRSNSNSHEFPVTLTVTTPSSPSPLCENTPPRFSPVAHTYDYAKNSHPRPVAVAVARRPTTNRHDFDLEDSGSGIEFQNMTSVDTSFRRILLHSRSLDSPVGANTNTATPVNANVPNTSGSANVIVTSELGSASTSASPIFEQDQTDGHQQQQQQQQQPHSSSSSTTTTQNTNTNSETDEERRLREEAESEALARALMAEEAMASYNQSAAFLHDHADQYSDEDLAALRAIMAEESPLIMVAEEDDDDEGNVILDEEGGMGMGMDSEELSYDALLNLGERIGDVKQERWALRAKDEIAKLPCQIFCFDTMGKGKDENDSDVKCLVCQFPYEDGEEICTLPCRHYFHKECVSQWLMAKDFCPYCRQCIVKDD